MSSGAVRPDAFKTRSGNMIFAAKIPGTYNNNNNNSHVERKRRSGAQSELSEHLYFAGLTSRFACSVFSIKVTCTKYGWILRAYRNLGSDSSPAPLTWWARRATGKRDTYCYMPTC